MKHERHRDKTTNGKGQSLRLKVPWCVPLHFPFPSRLQPHAGGGHLLGYLYTLQRVVPPRTPTALSRWAAQAAGRAGALSLCSVCQEGCPYTCAGETKLCFSTGKWVWRPLSNSGSLFGS